MHKQWTKIYRNERYTLSFCPMMGYKIWAHNSTAIIPTTIRCANSGKRARVNWPVVHVNPHTWRMSAILFQGKYKSRKDLYISPNLLRALPAMFRHWTSKDHAAWAEKNDVRMADFWAMLDRRDEERRQQKQAA